ncbi:viroplasmin family protein [bacterium]|nr:viroplasmin family protein [bacterium]
MDKIIIYADGASSGNPGPSGWGAIVSLPTGDVYELGGGDSRSTNNKMELTGVIEGLNSLNKNDEQIIILTDSAYVLKGITAWIFGWKKRGWKTAEGKEVLNADLWEALDKAVMRVGSKNIEWRYVRGHTGIKGNERVDEIAVAFSQNKSIELYKGPAARYHFDIKTLPPFAPIPEMTGKSSKPSAPYAYLSLLGQTAMRHANWAECEARVKGVSGAKFKKVMSAEEETKVLEGWGVALK